ncbi:MAG: hypothetical protein CVU55_05500 [Deltaproteobacteria bacterium HGW-Deltaproteobacteria-13]|jgi:N-acetylglutamate synthase-like GNAT family acetyltransferase|nr:MAG: hypothetical protein CVU55_05500 [Deltaproteobacteria bacterium HGW-Deltaproteobacteria-13]
MKIQEFIDNLGCTIATKEDNQTVLDFYHSLVMQGGKFNIKFVKGPDYFTFMEYESRIHYVLYFKNSEGRLEVMGSLSVRPCYIDGKVEYVGHFSDLRAIPKKERKTNFDWKQFSLAILAKYREIEELKGCRYILGSYIMANRKAVTAFKERSPFGISEISRYRMVSIIGRKPLKLLGKKSHKNPGMKVTVATGQDKDTNDLKEFLDSQNKKRMLGYVFAGEHDELARRFKDWDDFSIKSFYIARDEKGKVIGCFALWNPTRGRKIVIDKFPKALGTAVNIVKLVGRKAPKQGAELEILYLTTLELSHALTADQKKYVFNEMLDSLYKSKINKKYHMIAFCDYDRQNISEGMDKDYILQKTPTHLYQMVHPDSQDIIREEDYDIHVGHEMVLT